MAEVTIDVPGKIATPRMRTIPISRSQEFRTGRPSAPGTDRPRSWRSGLLDLLLRQGLTPGRP